MTVHMTATDHAIIVLCLALLAIMAAPVTLFVFAVVENLWLSIQTRFAGYTERERHRIHGRVDAEAVSEAGFGLIEMLIALAVFAALTAMIGQSLVTIFQANHESNASAGIVDVMQAESSYKQLYGSYATGSNAAYLSACPTSGPPTATAACLTSKTFTNGAAYNNYTWAISTPPDAGFLVIAQPQNVYAGRLTYCGSATDPLVHGLVSKTVPSIATAADCSALPPQKQGATTPTTTAYNTRGNGTTNYGETATLTLTLPPGSYHLQGHLAFIVSNTDRQLWNYPDASVACLLAAPATIDQGVASTPSNSGNTAVGVSQNIFLNGVAGVTGATTVTMSCQDNAGALVGAAHIAQGEPMNWTASLTASPIDTVVTQ